MLNGSFFVIAILALLISTSHVNDATAASIDELVAAAKKEGRLSFYAP